MEQKVTVGVDRLPEFEEQLLKGKRFGLLTNPTGIDSGYRSTIDVCASIRSAKLSALFACEHGIRGDRQAGVKIPDEIDELTGLPVYSLYGEHTKPTADMLRGLDAIVFDIQDLGVRFYTYLSTLVYVMEACAEHGVEVIVLDRPNPLGGLTSEGGYIEERFFSMVGAWKMPFRTGLTIGEFARLVRDQMAAPCQLHVISMLNWTRNREYPDTGLAWLLPSPNMPTMDTVRVYAGNCLFEGTNLSEGRGTTKPFELIGAPWLDARGVCNSLNELSLPGVRFHPLPFTPVLSKHKGELCHGIMTFVTDKSAYRAVSTSLRLIHAIMKAHPKEFEWVRPGGEDSHYFIDVLSGSDRVRLTLHEEGALESILADWERDQLHWESIRTAYHLYD
ncbi:exo-beta-N-acetylmuramidase NamZ domain-containing protein [Cohnella hongkongensis]|uniref:Exo-beta-N-acetylmuramidase NamZ domain-containing protein n=1 Tax=Cohnella hongkongensis TaxID=178337 RepID=A0ABV9FMN1_9BACL